MPAILEAKDVSKSSMAARRSRPDHVSLTIVKEFAAIQGTSGSGKSTLLNMLGGLDHPTSGDVFFAQRALGPLSKKEMARYRRYSVGMIFQNFNLVPTMSAAENVGLALAFGGLRGVQRKKRAEELLGRVGLSDRLTHRPSELSGGEQQRVAIARALANRRRSYLRTSRRAISIQRERTSCCPYCARWVNHDSLTIRMVTHDHELQPALPTESF